MAAPAATVVEQITQRLDTFDAALGVATNRIFTVPAAGIGGDTTALINDIRARELAAPALANMAEDVEALRVQEQDRINALPEDEKPAAQGALDALIERKGAAADLLTDRAKLLGQMEVSNNAAVEVGMAEAAFTVAAAAVNTAASLAIIERTVTNITAGGISDDAITEELRIAGEAVVTFQGRVETLRLAGEALNTAGANARAALNNLGDGVDPSPYAAQIQAIDAKSAECGVQYQAANDELVRQQRLLGVMRDYGDAAKRGRLDALTALPGATAAVSGNLQAAFTDNADLTADVTKEAITAAAEVVSRYKDHIETHAKRQYDDYKVVADPTIAALQGAGLNDQADAIKVKLDGFKDACDEAEVNLLALQAEEVDLLTARNEEAYNDIVAGPEQEVDEALAAYNAAEAGDDTNPDYENKLNEAREQLEEKRAALDTASAEYFKVSNPIYGRLRDLRANTEAQEIADKYTKVRGKLYYDPKLLAESANKATTALTALDHNDKLGADCLNSKITFPGARTETVQSVINDFVAPAPAPNDTSAVQYRDKARTALYKHLNTLETEFNAAQAAFDAYDEEAKKALAQLTAKGITNDAAEPRKSILAKQTELEASLNKVAGRRELIAQRLSTKLQETTLQPALNEIAAIDAKILELQDKQNTLSFKILTADKREAADLAELDKNKKELAKLEQQRHERVTALTTVLTNTTNFGGMQELGRHQLHLKNNVAELKSQQLNLNRCNKLSDHFKTKADEQLKILTDLQVKDAEAKAAHEKANTDAGRAAGDPAYVTPAAEAEKMRVATVALRRAHEQANRYLKEATQAQEKITAKAEKLVDENNKFFNEDQPAVTDDINTQIEKDINSIDSVKTQAETVDIETKKEELATLVTDMDTAGVSPTARSLVAPTVTASVPFDDFKLALHAKRLQATGLPVQQAAAGKVLESLKAGAKPAKTDLDQLPGQKDGIVAKDALTGDLDDCKVEEKKDGAILITKDKEFTLEVTGNDQQTSIRVEPASDSKANRGKNLEAGIGRAVDYLNDSGAPKAVFISNIKDADRIPAIITALDKGDIVAIENGNDGEAACMWKAYQLLARGGSNSTHLEKKAEDYINLLLKPENGRYLEKFLDGVLEKGHCEDKIVYWPGEDHSTVKAEVYTKDDLMDMAETNPDKLKTILLAQAQKKDGLLSNDFKDDRAAAGLPPERSFSFGSGAATVKHLSAAPDPAPAPGGGFLAGIAKRFGR